MLRDRAGYHIHFTRETQRKGMVISMIYFKQLSDIMHQDDEGKHILFNARTSSVHVLTEIGFEIWNSCEEYVSSNEILDRLRYLNFLDESVENEQYQEALENFLQELIKRGLITANELSSDSNRIQL